MDGKHAHPELIPSNKMQVISARWRWRWRKQRERERGREGEREREREREGGRAVTPSSRGGSLAARPPPRNGARAFRVPAGESAVRQPRRGPRETARGEGGNSPRRFLLWLRFPAPQAPGKRTVPAQSGAEQKFLLAPLRREGLCPVSACGLVKRDSSERTVRLLEAYKSVNHQSIRPPFNEIYVDVEFQSSS